MTSTRAGKRMPYSAVVTTQATERALGIQLRDHVVALAATDADVPKLVAMAGSYRPDRAVQNGEATSYMRAFDEREQRFTRALVQSNTNAREAQQRRFDRSPQQSAESRNYARQ